MPPVQQVWDFPGIPDDILFSGSRGSLSTKASSSASELASATPSATPDLNPNTDTNTDTNTNILTKRILDDANANTKTLTARSGNKSYIPGKGAVDPDHINMKGLYALFAILGVAFVLAGIWFFFWAKNGGFVWRRGDWEEYKSTVLRRKGPDGKTLSNATKSTKLGGGSVVGKGYSDYDGYTESGLGYTDTATTMTEKGPKDEKRKKKKTGGDGEQEKGKRTVSGGAAFLREIARRKFLRRRADPEEPWNGEEYEDDDVRAYRQEKAARVGGLNRQAEGTYHGSDYDTSNPPTHYNDSEMSEVRDYAIAPAHRAPPPAHKASRHQSKRQSRNFSFIPGTEESVSQVAAPAPATDPRRHRSTRTNNDHRTPRDRDQRRLREPDARRHNRRRERRRNPPAAATDSTSSVAQNERRERRAERDQHRRSLPPAGQASEISSSTGGTRSEQYSSVYTDDESGTRAYNHPIPGLSKGYRREGGRRKRRDSLSDSE